MAKTCALGFKKELPLMAKKKFRVSAFLLGSFFLCISSGMTASASERRPSLLSKFFSPESCIAKIDWSEVGLADGKLGIEPSYFEVYEKLCARRSRAPDKQAYFQAYRIGVQFYCDPGNIYQLARRGSVAIGACGETPAVLKAVQRGFANILE